MAGVIKRAKLLASGLSMAGVLLAATGSGGGYLASAAAASGHPVPVSGSWISFRDGHLVYGHDAQGNRIPDFSYAGYEQSDAPIPFVPARVRVSPDSAADDTSLIQAAIDQVSALPLDRRGFRGAVVLAPGTYKIGSGIHISAAGVVLRGGGKKPADTVLLPQNPLARTLITAGGTGSITAVPGSSHNVTDAYVPVGADVLHLDSTAGLSPGDRVIVQRPQTQPWIHAIGMDSIPPRPDGKPITQWPPNSGLQFERVITRIKGNEITLDVPLTNALEQAFTQATVWKYTFGGRISQVGIENLSSDGIAMAADPAILSNFFNATFVNLNAVENAWVRDVIVTRYCQPFQVGSGGYQISILHTQSLHMEQAMPQSVSDQPFTYGVSGQLVLVRDATVTGSNVHTWTTQSRVPGPNVFSDFTEINTGQRKFDSGPHQRWATGILAEDMTMQSTPGVDWAATELEDRQWFGSGQGWAGANSVLWNVSSTTWRVEEPATAHNWAIGIMGTEIAPHPTPFQHAEGEIEARGQQVFPMSLFATQLAERHQDQP